MELTPPQSLFPWRRNLGIAWTVQLMSVMGFTFVHPFLPLFIQENLGVNDPKRAVFWAGAAGASMGVGMVIGGPIWGIVGDRYGHKKNAARALVGSVIILAVTGFSANVYQLVALRFIHGLITGVIPAIMALGVSQAPKERMNFAVGIIQMSLFTGITTGPLLGGLMSEAAGFRGAFFGASGILAVGLAAILFGAREVPRSAESALGLSLRSYFSDFLHMLTTGPLPKVLAVIVVIYMAHLMTHPVLPVLVEEIDPQVRIASVTGFLFGAMGLASVVGSLAVARYGPAIGLQRITVAFALLAGGVFSFMYLAQDLVQVFVIVTVVGLCAGVMMAAGNAAVAVMSPATQYGRAFGAVQCMTATGATLGTITGGGMAELLGLREVFLISAVLFLLIAITVFRFIPMGEPDARTIRSTGAVYKRGTSDMGDESRGVPGN